MNAEPTPVSLSAVEIAAHQVRQLSADRESQPGAVLPIAELRLMERLEDDRQAFRRNSTAAVLDVTPVHYLFRPHDDTAMLTHFRAIVDETGLPVVIYNVVPWSYLSPHLLVRILQEVPGVVGVKQSAGDLKLLADLLETAPQGARILSAVDALLYPSFTLGAHGAIAAILTAAPRACVLLWQAVAREDHGTARRLHSALLRLWNALAGDNLPAWQLGAAADRSTVASCYLDDPGAEAVQQPGGERARPHDRQVHDRDPVEGPSPGDRIRSAAAVDAGPPCAVAGAVGAVATAAAAAARGAGTASPGAAIPGRGRPAPRSSSGATRRRRRCPTRRVARGRSEGAGAGAQEPAERPPSSSIARSEHPAPSAPSAGGGRGGRGTRVGCGQHEWQQHMGRHGVGVDRHLSGRVVGAQAAGGQRARRQRHAGRQVQGGGRQPRTRVGVRRGLPAPSAGRWGRARSSVARRP